MICGIRKWWIHSGAEVGANNDRPHTLSYAGNFHTPGGPFTFLSSDKLSACAGGLLNCRISPACAWKPDVWGSTTTVHMLDILTCPVAVLEPGLQPKNNWGGWPIPPAFLTHMREIP
ncbi:hypothetical protein O181_050964 [Austropuccinia psidii MF-1]|uniref:Uncharacterized protein n=1 Tax=Austropuccinia psidii MF-1 TaxID=1389203 RepID=A0A9Q3DXR0_9BASI|nr:hypothetical protein [Austropuccinia psidii MF-1]